MLSQYRKGHHAPFWLLPIVYGLCTTSVGIGRFLNEGWATPNFSFLACLIGGGVLLLIIGFAMIWYKFFRKN